MAADLYTGTLQFREYVQPIEKWEVWFRTPLGLSATLDEAQKILTIRDLPADLIVPVPVAISKNHWEVVERG